MWLEYVPPYIFSIRTNKLCFLPCIFSIRATETHLPPYVFSVRAFLHAYILLELLKCSHSSSYFICFNEQQKILQMLPRLWAKCACYSGFILNPTGHYRAWVLGNFTLPLTFPPLWSHCWINKVDKQKGLRPIK